MSRGKQDKRPSYTHALSLTPRDPVSLSSPSGSLNPFTTEDRGMQTQQRRTQQRRTQQRRTHSCMRRECGPSLRMEGVAAPITCSCSATAVNGCARAHHRSWIVINPPPHSDTHTPALSPALFRHCAPGQTPSRTEVSA